ncbi:DUF6106 family protein [Clostridium folliculivorans]|uniref:Uncharacterized protein n=1 Tax=Clostridium folliculivorans TaxID=2886038 RepID=A0A9W6DC41_9CLOT|nr:DUF6106 family protein [Clostridium folliculivorans]GKU27105.1 hypothetical protein CFOLD11_39320 [Clostridium folliculivorans]GKU31722.1 hypothetical protein CFB3_38290 [Clostridium folliculivorans]
MDQFKEQLVRAQNPGKYKAVKILMYIVGVLAVLCLLTGNFILGLLLVVIAGILFYVKRFFYLEFEYVITNGEVDVDVIYETTTRKKKMSFNMKEVSLLAPYESDEYKALSNKPSKIITAIPEGNKDRAYVAVVTEGNDKAQLIFVPNQEFVNICFLFNPKVVKKN